MKTRILAVLLAVAGLFVMLTGCATDKQSADAKQQIVAPEAPPSPKADESGMSPGATYAWVPGFWVWRDAWLWVPGRWTPPPRPHALWIGGHWDKVDTGYAWTPGYWQ